MLGLAGAISQVPIAGRGDVVGSSTRWSGLDSRWLGGREHFWRFSGGRLYLIKFHFRWKLCGVWSRRGKVENLIYEENFAGSL